MTSFHRRVRSSKIQVVNRRGLQPGVQPPRLNRWLTQPGENGQVPAPAKQDQTHRAGFRGLNPNRREALEGAFKFGGRRGGHKPGRCGRSAILSGRLRHSTPRAARSGALLAAGRRPGGAEGGPPRPAPASAGWWRGRGRAPRASASRRDSGPAGARQADTSARSRPPLGRAQRPQDGVGRAPRRARTPARARPFTLSLTVSVTPAPGRDGTGTPQSRPPFPKEAPTLSPPSHAALRRRKAATPVPLLRVPDRPRSTSAAGPALGAAAAAGTLTVGVVSRQWRRRLSPAPRSSPHVAPALFHPRDRERHRRHAYYGAGRRSPDSARRAAARAPPTAPRPARTRPRPAPAPAARRVFLERRAAE